MSAVNGVKRTVDHWKDTARADNNAAAMGSLSSDETMQHHAAIASIRPDLPMLLPTVRLLIGILSGPANIDRRNEVGGCPPEFVVSRLSFGRCNGCTSRTQLLLTADCGQGTPNMDARVPQVSWISTTVECVVSRFFAKE